MPVTPVTPFQSCPCKVRIAHPQTSELDPNSKQSPAQIALTRSHSSGSQVLCPCHRLRSVELHLRRIPLLNAVRHSSATGGRAPPMHVGGGRVHPARRNIWLTRGFSGNAGSSWPYSSESNPWPEPKAPHTSFSIQVSRTARLGALEHANLNAFERVAANLLNLSDRGQRRTDAFGSPRHCTVVTS